MTRQDINDEYRRILLSYPAVDLNSSLFLYTIGEKCSNFESLPVDEALNHIFDLDDFLNDPEWYKTRRIRAGATMEELQEINILAEELAMLKEWNMPLVN